MKKSISIMMLAAAAAAASVSCTKETIQPQAREIKVSLLADEQVELTKTFLDGTTLKWKDTDAIGVFDGSSTTNARFTNKTGEGASATFEGTVPSAGSFYAYYPFSDNGANENGVLIEIPQDQKPTPTSFDGAADLLLSEAVKIEETSAEVKLAFHRQVGFLKVYFADGTTGGRLAGEYASAVSVQEDNGEERLVGTFRLGTDGPKPISSGWRKVNATFEANTYELVADGQAAWFGVLPQTFGSGSKLTITGETGQYSFSKTITLTEGRTLAAGQALPIRITLEDANVVFKSKPIHIEKIWENLSTSSAAWTSTLSTDGATFTDGNDFSVAIDDQYVYVTEFGGSKRLWAIDINDKSNVRLVNTSTVESVGFDGSIFLSCARVVRKNDGTPVLVASNLFQDGTNDATGRLYIWDDGIDQAPRVAKLQQWGAGRRLGDTFSTYGNYEDCWLIFGTQTGNGFVTFQLPRGNASFLTSRLAIDLTNFASYYPFPGEITRGMFSWRGGTHDDGAAYRNRLMTVDSTEEAIKTQGAHTAMLSKLGTWMSNFENNNGIGFNYIEFNGKRYVIWCLNRSDSNSTFDLLIKEGETTTDWATIIDTPGTVYRETFEAGMNTTWKMGADAAVWNTGSELYIAVGKTQCGLAVFRLYTD